MRLALACVLLTGCFVSAEDLEGTATVEQDVEFWREPQGPGSYSQCQMDSGFHCDYRLRVCANGVMNSLFGDVVASGTYHLEGAVAVGDGGSLDMRFDLDTLSDGVREWMPVTDSGILDCSTF